MDAALKHAIGELLLSAVPTIVLFLSLYLAYFKLVHQPLMKVLAERHSKTAGAVAKAQADIAEAEARTRQQHPSRPAYFDKYLQALAAANISTEAGEAAGF